MDIVTFLSRIRDIRSGEKSSEFATAIDAASATFWSMQDALRDEYSLEDSAHLVTQLVLLYVLDTLQREGTNSPSTVLSNLADTLKQGKQLASPATELDDPLQL